MSSVEPSPEECETWVHVGDVAKWAGFSSEDSSHLTAIISLYQLLGLSATTHVRVLAAIPEADFDDLVRSWVIEEAAPTPALRALAGLLGRGARIAGGTQLRIKEVQRNTELVLAASARKNQADNQALKDPNHQNITIKLSKVLDQTSEVEANALSQDQIDAAYRR